MIAFSTFNWLSATWNVNKHKNTHEIEWQILYAASKIKQKKKKTHSEFMSRTNDSYDVEEKKKQ